MNLSYDRLRQQYIKRLVTTKKNLLLKNYLLMGFTITIINDSYKQERINFKLKMPISNSGWVY